MSKILVNMKFKVTLESFSIDICLALAKKDKKIKHKLLRFENLDIRASAKDGKF